MARECWNARLASATRPTSRHGPAVWQSSGVPPVRHKHVMPYGQPRRVPHLLHRVTQVRCRDSTCLCRSAFATHPSLTFPAIATSICHRYVNKSPIGECSCHLLQQCAPVQPRSCWLNGPRSLSCSLGLSLLPVGRAWPLPEAGASGRGRPLDLESPRPRNRGQRNLPRLGCPRGCTCQPRANQAP